MAKLSDVYGITRPPKGGPGKAGTKGSAAVKLERTAVAVTQKGRPAGSRVERAREAVAGMAPAGVRFLMKITPEVSAWLEGERGRRGLRSRIATINAIIEGARK